MQLHNNSLNISIFVSISTFPDYFLVSSLYFILLSESSYQAVSRSSAAIQPMQWTDINTLLSTAIYNWTRDPTVWYWALVESRKNPFLIPKSRSPTLTGSCSNYSCSGMIVILQNIKAWGGISGDKIQSHVWRQQPNGKQKWSLSSQPRWGLNTCGRESTPWVDGLDGHQRQSEEGWCLPRFMPASVHWLATLLHWPLSSLSVWPVTIVIWFVSLSVALM